VNATLAFQNKILAESLESVKKRLNDKKNSLSTVLDALKDAKIKVDFFLAEPLHSITIRAYESALMCIYVGNKDIWQNLDLGHLHPQMVNDFSDKVH